MASCGVACVAIGCASSVPPDANLSVRLIDCTAQHAEEATPVRLPPLAVGEPFADLPVRGHGPAVVSVPRGATSPRPVVVAAHGAGDRPDWQCRFWREVLGDDAFVLCPRGVPMDARLPEDQTGYFYTTHIALGEEITAGLTALAERFEGHVDLSAPVFAGFSQGAIMGALLLPTHPARFARAVLIEGGYGGFQEWNLRMAQRLRERGGDRVVMACGRAECAEEGEVSAGFMRREGLEARVVHAQGAGHTYGGAVGDEVVRAFSWLVERDVRFAAARAAREQ